MKIDTVVIVCDFAYIEGGATKVAVDTARLLLKEGKRVIYFCGSERVDRIVLPEPIEIVSTQQPDLKTNPSKVDALRMGWWNGKSEAMLGALLDKLNSESTVVHIHHWAKILSPSIFRVLRRSGFRTFYTCHVYYLACGNGAFYDYRHNFLCHRTGGGLSCLLCNCDRGNYIIKLWRFVRQMIVKWQLRQFQTLCLITISQLNEQVMRQTLGSGFRYVRVNNPIELPDAVCEGAAGEKFFFVGRICQEKAPELFARALVECGESGVIIGDGPDAAKLKRKYPSMEFTGWLTHMEIRKRVQQEAACYVFASVWYECAPLTPLEMMAMGIPCIISDATAAVEYIEDGVTGLVFRSGDIEDLKHKIMFMSKKANRDRFCSEIRKRFDRTGWSPESYVKNLVRCFEGEEVPGGASYR